MCVCIFDKVYFDEVYMNPKDNELAESFINAPEFIKECKKVGLTMPAFKPIKGGDVEICEGKTENDLPYQWFGGEAKQHPFKLEEGKTYQQLESVICYR
ncbi:hypothetical protein [Butyrivibrio sp. YAB3001]|uniref:hypothetical protein n=1 Tax=Butyrivibrio sp. YAB3001 TaxID=1520812 RepID=UPI0008F63C5D|nr:hypothetical protein [Butyrivibrio sp. YAB3001]SFC50982.1 hypothetical protein SAMN02910398_02450 [Butyrivibrio sp. YAB3001]